MFHCLGAEELKPEDNINIFWVSTFATHALLFLFLICFTKKAKTTLFFH